MATLPKLLKQPVPMPQALSSTRQRLRHWRLIDVLLLLPTGILCGAVSGALMNAFNGWISPDYFSMTGLFSNAPVGWAGAVGYGCLVGLKIGAVFSLIFMSVVAITSRLKCPYRIGLRAILRGIALIFLFWFAGGLSMVGIRLLFPETLENVLTVFKLLQRSPLVPVLRLGWVIGSTIGVYLGGITALIINCIWFSADWRKYKAQRELTRDETRKTNSVSLHN